MRERNTTIDLLFDSLGTVNNGGIEPWLATSWDWTEPDASEQASTLTATVTLREDCQFHDGEPLTPRMSPLPIGSSKTRRGRARLVAGTAVSGPRRRDQ